MGLFPAIIESFVKDAPQQMYQYLLEHRDAITNQFILHFHHLSFVEIMRYLLDIPAYSMRDALQ